MKIPGKGPVSLLQVGNFTQETKNVIDKKLKVKSTAIIVIYLEIDAKANLAMARSVGVKTYHLF